ncbi:hypothetical protein LCGC14_2855990, partial [marine sediment metagenome]
MVLLSAGAAWGQQVTADGAPDLARWVLAAAKVRSGLCVHVGCGDGRLTGALTGRGNFITHGLALNEASLAKARSHLTERGLYGKASVELLSPTRLPYAARTVNLLVADDLPAAFQAGLSLKEVLRVLVPGGVAMLGRSPGTGKGALSEADLKA